MLTWSQCVPITKMGACGAWHLMELSQKSKPACSYPSLVVHSNKYTARLDRKNYNHIEEQIIQEFALDGAVACIGFEVIGQVCLHSNVMGCQHQACFCFNKTSEHSFWYLVHINNTFRSCIKLVCANLEQNVYLVIQRYEKQFDFTAIDPTLWLGPSEYTLRLLKVL